MRTRSLLTVLVSLLFCAGLVYVYFPTLNLGLVLDDPINLADNQSLRSLATALVPDGDSFLVGRPLANLSFAVDFALFGANWEKYRLINVMLHGATALAVAWTFYTLWENVPRTDSVRSTARAVAGIAAGLWAFHPVHTAAVNHLSQRTEMLATFFYLLAVAWFVRSWREERPVFSWSVSLLCAVLSGLCKELIVTFPLVALVLDLAYHPTLPQIRLRQRRLFYGASFLLSSVVGVRALQFAGSHLGLGGDHVGLADAAAHALVSLSHYARALFWPVDLAFDYGIVIHRTVTTEAWVFGALFVLVVVVLVRLRRWRTLAVFSLPFVILAPTTSLLVVLGQPIADHRCYLASVVVVGTLAEALQGLNRSLRVVGPVLIGVLGLLTQRENQLFRAEDVLYETITVRVPDNGRAWFRRSEIALQAGNLQTAKTFLVRSYEAFRSNSIQDPNNILVLRELALVAARMGKHQEAEVALKTIVERYPESGRDLLSLGNAVYFQGQYAQAIEWYDRAATHLKDPTARLNAAVARCDLPASRRRGLQELRELCENPAVAAQAKVQLAIVLARSNLNWTEPIRLLKEAIELNPRLALAHYNLGLIRSMQPDGMEEAILHYRKAVELNGESIEARYNLALALSRRPPTREEALAGFEAVLELDPENAMAKHMVEKLVKESVENALGHP